MTGGFVDMVLRLGTFLTCAHVVRYVGIARAMWFARVYWWLLGNGGRDRISIVAPDRINWNSSPFSLPRFPNYSVWEHVFFRR